MMNHAVSAGPEQERRTAPSMMTMNRELDGVRDLMVEVGGM